MAAPPSKKSHFVVVIFFLLTLQTSSATEAIADAEVQVLLNLKTALRESNPEAFDSWKEVNSKCNFTGITCGLDGAVTEMELSNLQLAGTLPISKICQMRSLEKLAFRHNSLRGRISPDLNNCIRLRYLDLSQNLFKGPFPPILSLNRLRFLYLSLSGITGSFPWISLNNLMNSLRVLSIGDNLLDRSPFPVEVTKCYNLNGLYLSNSSIDGRIPAGIGNLTRLVDLELSDNHLSGEIPPEIGMLSNLWQLELYGNYLTGKLPIGLRNLTNLQFFDASRNRLQGDLSELRFLSNLVSLQVYENQLAGEVPWEFGEFRHLVNLSLYMNNLTGQLPRALGSWAKFNFIDVSENFLTGPIPPDMCKQGTMKKLLMLDNKFTGNIPATYASCSTLIRFRVSQNLLSGVVPAGIWGLPELEMIDVEFNRLEGAISPSIAKAKSLAQLSVADNQLGGELPAELSEASSLAAIDLSNNRFHGKIPAKIGELKRLSSLDFENNDFSGSLPESLGSCGSLSLINIANNSITGAIPPILGSLRNLNSLNLSGNRISGEIPSALSSLQLSLLDLSNNTLTGPVPESLSIDAYNGSFVRNAGLCGRTSSYLPRCPSSPRPSKKYRSLFVGFLVMLTMLLLLVVFLLLHRKRRGEFQKRQRSGKRSVRELTSFQKLSFTAADIVDSIREDNLIGKGGSGEVYRVPLADGVELAVKRIWNTDPGSNWSSSQSSSPVVRRPSGKSREFDAEVLALSSIRHVNVVKLHCSITDDDCSLLVYDYMRNGSLWDFLHTCRKSELPWLARYEIAVGTCKGLAYLHHGCEKTVIHRDVKSSNILLDDFLKPKIADFGLAKIVTGNSSTHVIAGTPGYIPPEYGFSYKITQKCDVYSFGVVLMELVTGKKPLDVDQNKYNDIVHWVNEMERENRLVSIIDPIIQPEASQEEALKVLEVSILCTVRLPEHRPSMRTVLKMLDWVPHPVKESKIEIDYDVKPFLKSV